VRSRSIGLLFWVSVGCADAAMTPAALVPSAGTSSAPISDLPIDPCERGALTLVPERVTDLVDHINTLPKPTTLDCVLTSLPRPLALNATRSILSAQPAVGQRSPRVFVLYDKLILSVALDGMGKDLLEFGELRPEARTVKAEIEFPVTSQLTHAAPFEQVMFQEGQTSCAFCHASESRDESIGFTDAFVSVAYRPTERQAQVTIAEMAAQLEQCDHSAEPERCAMLEALFARGMPIEQDFPADFRTFQ
jgi:hypothetical protein